jgi:hypothetical protein
MSIGIGVACQYHSIIEDDCAQGQCSS